MELGKPPVIEAWIEFRFAVDEHAPYWDEALAERFIQEDFSSQFRVESYHGHTRFRFEPGTVRPSIADAQVVFERLRATHKEGNRFLQVGRDVLVYNLLRKHDYWPSYQVLRTEAIEAYEKYVSFRRPSQLSGIALHYRDVVPLPLDASGQVDIDQYLAIHTQVPRELFPIVRRFRISLSVERARGELRLDVGNDPVAAAVGDGGSEAKIRIDWHIVSSGNASLSPEWVQNWLDWAHADLRCAFRGVFTDKGWALLEPKES